jgi:LacI family transcriptional regulator
MVGVAGQKLLIRNTHTVIKEISFSTGENPSGQPAASQRSFKVILLIESSRAAGRNLLKGIAQFSHLHGPWSFYWEPGGLDLAQPMLQALDADGIILRDLHVPELELSKLGIPVVVVGHIGREVPGLINVVTDSAAIGSLAAEHLLRCGFKNFAFCGWASTPIEQAPWSACRLESFRDRLVQAGCGAPAAYVLPPAMNNWQESRRKLAGWLRQLPKPVGVLACNDDCGAQIVEACKFAGLNVPDEVGVIGVDNDEIVCGLSDPSLSSISVNFERAGYEAAEALCRLMEKKTPAATRISVPATHLVARRSTDVTAVPDSGLARALNYIRDHARHPCSVDDVAREAGISRRALERRFRQHMGVSVLEEIRRVRANEIARLLLETNWSVAQIAHTLEFSDERHVARYFSSVHQMSPLAFRKHQGSISTKPVS